MRVCPSCHLEYRVGDRDRCLVDGALLEERQDPRIGTVLSGRYVIEAVLGEGGMATVYRARHTLVERPCAVKILHRAFAGDASVRERLRREARSAAGVVHPNVVEVYDFGETSEGQPYLVMELLEGESLRARLANGPLPIAEAVALGAQVARGLARAHDFGVVHRDLKPENVILVSDAAGRPLVKLVDFGLARTHQDHRLTRTGELVGTPAYMAPEQITDQAATPGSDLYSLGVVLFEMLAGRHPFESKSAAGYVLAHLEVRPDKLRARRSDCPELLEVLVAQLLAKRPAERPVDAHEVVKRLTDLAPEGEWRVEEEPRVARTIAAPARGEGSGTLQQWEDRLALYADLLSRVHARRVPLDQSARLDAMQAAVESLRVLREQGMGDQRRLEALEQETLEGRERLGHAAHSLATDLSEARGDVRHIRDEVARLQSALRAREVEVTDLEFQIGALRAQLDRLERSFDQRAAALRGALSDNGGERRRLEMRLRELARELLEPLRERPEVRPHLAGLVPPA